jgi:predicted O-methyltransferase YrrM
MSAMKVLGWKSFHDAQRANAIVDQSDLIAAARILIADGYNAFADWPWCRDPKALVAEFPEARFIYTVRPFAEWVQSLASHPTITLKAEQHSLAELRTQFDKHHETCMEIVSITGGLVMRVGDEWNVLCPWLGVKAAQTEYPHKAKDVRPWPASVPPVIVRNYTSDWVSVHHADWLKHAAGLTERPVRILEIGSWEGRSVLWWLDNVATHKNSQVITVDRHRDPERWKRFLSNIASHEDAHKVVPIKGDSRKIVPQLTDQSIDLTYIDGSHEGRDVLLDGSNAYHKTKIGGVILFDDYQWNPAGNPRHVLPGPAIDTFVDLFSDVTKVIHKDYQLAVRRTS